MQAIRFCFRVLPTFASNLMPVAVMKLFYFLVYSKWLLLYIVRPIVTNALIGVVTVIYR